jgi:hypothetical protein
MTDPRREPTEYLKPNSVRYYTLKHIINGRVAYDLYNCATYLP